MSKDYYKILGVEKNASGDEIKKAFKKGAMQYHPDRPGGNEAKFKEINEAYQVLGDAEKRKKYDQFGSDFEQQGGFGGASWEDVMNQFRGGGGAGLAAPILAIFLATCSDLVAASASAALARLVAATSR